MASDLAPAGWMLMTALAEQSRLNEEMKAEEYRRGVEDAAKVAENAVAGQGAHLGFEGRKIAAAIRSLPDPKEGE